MIWESSRPKNVTGDVHEMMKRNLYRPQELLFEICQQLDAHQGNAEGSLDLSLDFEAEGNDGRIKSHETCLIHCQLIMKKWKRKRKNSKNFCDEEAGTQLGIHCSVKTKTAKENYFGTNP